MVAWVSTSVGEFNSLAAQMYAVGPRPNVDLMNTLDASVVTPGGIRVRNTFQIEHPSINNIFVVGDVVCIFVTDSNSNSNSNYFIRLVSVIVGMLTRPSTLMHPLSLTTLSH